MALPIGGNSPLPLELAQLRRNAPNAESGASKSASLSTPTPAVGGPSGDGITPFAEKLRDLLSETNATHEKAQTAADGYARGNNHDLHGTMIDMAQADVSIRLLANVRNRMIDAYREVMRMGG